MNHAASKRSQLIQTAINTIFTLTAAGVISTAHAATAKSSDATEKCYGVVKTGLNDCQTATAKCAGSATKDGQADAFVFMPKGLCAKIVGGSLK